MAKIMIKSKRSGFSLVEITMVLVVIGVILGGIWTAASHAMANAKTEHMIEDINLTVNNMRAYYTGQLTIPPTDLGTLTTQLLVANVIPNDLLRPVAMGTCTNQPPTLPKSEWNMCADTVWGQNDNVDAGGTPTVPHIDTAGTFRVCTWKLGIDGACDAGAASPVFGIALRGLTAQNCITLAQAISGPRGPKGLVEIDINGYNFNSHSLPISPVTISDATTQCTSVTDPSVILRFVYRLTPPAI